MEGIGRIPKYLPRYTYFKVSCVDLYYKCTLDTTPMYLR